MPRAEGSQRKALDPLEVKLQTSVNCCLCWELNPQPSEEQPVLLITKLSVSPALISSFSLVFFAAVNYSLMSILVKFAYL